VSWRWNKVSRQFVLLLSVWAGYLPTQITIVCRSLKLGNCRRGGAEQQSNAEKSSVSGNAAAPRGTGLSMLLRWPLPFVGAPAWPGFQRKPAWSAFSLVPSSLWGFEASAMFFWQRLPSPACPISPRATPLPGCWDACCRCPEGCEGIRLGDSCQSGMPPPDPPAWATAAVGLWAWAEDVWGHFQL